VARSRTAAVVDKRLPNQCSRIAGWVIPQGRQQLHQEATTLVDRWFRDTTVPLQPNLEFGNSFIDDDSRRLGRCRHYAARFKKPNKTTNFVYIVGTQSLAPPHAEALALMRCELPNHFIIDVSQRDIGSAHPRHKMTNGTRIKLDRCRRMTESPQMIQKAMHEHLTNAGIQAPSAIMNSCVLRFHDGSLLDAPMASEEEP